MTDLLDMVVAAHGGLERWSAVQTIDVVLSITGVVWYVKGRPNVRNESERSFENQPPGAPWDDVHVVTLSPRPALT
jgi:hypothetical protein